LEIDVNQIEITKESRLSQIIGKPAQNIKDIGQELEDIELSDSSPDSDDGIRPPTKSPLLTKGKKLKPPLSAPPEDDIEVNKTKCHLVSNFLRNQTRAMKNRNRVKVEDLPDLV
jgi:hypothetical protein